jgi:hypothetical protein
VGIARLLIISLTAVMFIIVSPWIARAVDANADLASIYQATGPLSPAFSPSVTEYSVKMRSSETGYYTAATPSSSGATMEYSMNGGSWVGISSNTSTGYLETNRGNNTFQFRVTATDLTTTKTYTIHVYLPSLNDADLVDLRSSETTLSPSFQSSTTSYTASVPYTTSSISFTGVLNDSAASFKINGAAASDGVAYGPIPLNVGSNTLTVQTKSYDTTASKTYTIEVTRATPSMNADLSALTVAGNTLSPAFQSNQSAYTLSDVSYATSQMTVTPTIADSTATVQVRVNGGSFATVSSGSSSGPLALNVGSNSIQVKVSAQDGTTTNTYTMTMNRKSNNASLSGLTVTPGSLNETFASGTLAYTMADMNYATDTLTVTPTLSDTAGAFVHVKVNGGSYTPVTSGYGMDVPLTVGSNTVQLEVLAEDTSFSKQYTITVHRKNNDASLSGLTVTPGSLNEPFASSKLVYSMADVSYSTSSLTLTPTLSDTVGASVYVRINGDSYTQVPSGHPAPMSLKVGSNTVEVKVLAQDTAIAKIYTLTVLRLGNSDTSLFGLTFSSGYLDFSTQVTDYSLTVSRSTNALKVKPSLSANNTVATIQVRINGGSYSIVQSGMDSQSLSLASGVQNVINVLVTAQDGTNRLYTIKVNQSGTPVLNDLMIEGVKAKLTFSEPLRSITDATYYTIYNVNRNATLSVTEVVYTAGSPEVNLTVNGLLLPGDELEFRIKAGAVNSFIGETNAAVNRKIFYGDPLHQMLQRLADLDTDHDGIHINEIIAYMNTAFGGNDVNGDGQFTREDVLIILSQIRTKVIPSS